MAFVKVESFLGKKVCNNQVITTEIGYFEVDTEFKVVHEDKSDITNISRVLEDKDSGIQIVLDNKSFMEIMVSQGEKNTCENVFKNETSRAIYSKGENINNEETNEKIEHDKLQEELFAKLSEDCDKVIDYVKNMTVRDISTGKIPITLEKTAEEIVDNLTRLFIHGCDMTPLHKDKNNRK